MVVKPSIGASGRGMRLLKTPAKLSVEDEAFLAGSVDLALRHGVSSHYGHHHSTHRRNSGSGSFASLQRTNSASAVSISGSGALHNRNYSSSISSSLLADDRMSHLPSPISTSPANQTQPERIGSLMIQEFLPAITTAGEMSLCFAGSQLTHAFQKTPRAGGWQVGSEFGASFMAIPAEDVPPEARDIAERVIKWIEGRFGGTSSVQSSFSSQGSLPLPVGSDGERVGYARIDGIMTPRGFMLMEVELLEPSFGWDLQGVGEPAMEKMVAAILNA